MERDMLNIRQLECFRAIMTTGNMTQAAEMLGIAQPSASSLIANLEHSLGFELFERSKGRLIATPEARTLLPDVILSLETVELTKHRARQIKEDRRGDLSIVSYPDIAIDFLPSLLSRFLGPRPGVRVNLQARRTEMMSGLLPTHDYDLAITTRLAETRALHVQEFQIPCVAVYPKGYAPKHTNPVTVADLASSKMVTVISTHPTSIQLSERFSQAGKMHSDIVVETQTFESVCSFVRRGTGVGIVDATTASRYVNEVDVRSLEPIIWHNVYLLRPLDRPSSRLLSQFEEMVSDELRKFDQMNWV
jgi:DNA-binding transcriptional LysR family regulator